MAGSPAICSSRICLSPVVGALARQPPGALLDISGVQRRGNVLQDAWVACASPQAARCLEPNIEMRDPKEESHEDY
jgi:hypothetical protein